MQLPKAFVVKKADAGQLREEEIVAWLGKKVAPAKRLSGGVQFVDSIPKSASGKILRRLVKQLHRPQPGLEHHHHQNDGIAGGGNAKARL